MLKIFTHTFFKKYKVPIACFLILTLSAFLRFYQTPELFVFTADEEYAVTLALPIVKDFHIIWIGENAADTGFYMGPFWVYFTAFWLNISKSDPLILAYVVAGIGVITTLVIFFVARSMFGINAALISSLLYAALPLRVYYDRKFWLLNPAPLLVISLLYSLYQAKKNNYWWLAVAFLYGMVFHIHLSLLSLGVVIAYWGWKQRRQLNKKTVILSFLVFLIPLSPLIAFDYFHKGSNIATPLRLINETSNQKRSIDFGEHAGYLFQSFGRLLYLYPNRSNADEVLFACHPFGINKSLLTPGQNTTASEQVLLFSLFSAVLILWFFIKSFSWKKENTNILVYFLILLLASFIFYPGEVMEYYLSAVLTLFLFIPGILFSSLKGHLKYATLMIFIVLVASGTLTILSATNEYGMATKINLAKKVSSFLGPDNFELKETGMCHNYGGWRIIFTTYGKKPERSSADRSLGYLYPEEISNKPTKYTVIMSESRIPVKYDPNTTHIISEGGFQALIIKNFK